MRTRESLSLALNGVLLGGVAVVVSKLGWRSVALRLPLRRNSSTMLGSLAQEMFGAQIIPEHGVVLIGDSQAQFAPLLELITPYRQQAIAGSLASDLMAWIDPLLAQPVEHIAIMTGTNDVRRALPVAESVAAFTAVLDRIGQARPQCSVCIVSVPPLLAYAGAARELNDALCTLAAERGHDWVDLTDTLTGTDWTHDGVHLTPEAYRRIAGQLSTALHPARHG